MSDRLNIKLDLETADKITIANLEITRKELIESIDTDFWAERRQYGEGRYRLENITNNFQTLEAVNHLLFYFTGDKYE